MTTPVADFDAITDVLRSLGAEVDAAECHGTLCGLNCTIAGLETDIWLRICLSGEVLLSAGQQPLLQALYAVTARQFDSEDFDFQLLLPGDNARLEARIEALGNWCQGFLTGLAAGGVQDMQKLPGELPDMVGDLLRIADAESFDLDDAEEDETAYAELVEYVRMAVLLFREEFRAQAESARHNPSSRIH